MHYTYDGYAVLRESADDRAPSIQRQQSQHVFYLLKFTFLNQNFFSLPFYQVSLISTSKKANITSVNIHRTVSPALNLNDEFAKRGKAEKNCQS